MTAPTVRSATPAGAAWIEAVMVEHWGEPLVIAHGRALHTRAARPDRGRAGWRGTLRNRWHAGGAGPASRSDGRPWPRHCPGGGAYVPAGAGRRARALAYHHQRQSGPSAVLPAPWVQADGGAAEGNGGGPQVEADHTHGRRVRDPDQRRAAADATTDCGA